ncbi:MAG: hypothetical protein LBE72_01890 [Rickettsia sp.]|nr:hypothetical protein [Rickettsia sp.]
MQKNNQGHCEEAIPSPPLGSVNFYHNGMADKIMPLTGMENLIPTEIEQNQCRDSSSRRKSA